MTHAKVQRLLESIENPNNLYAIHITSPLDRFKLKYDQSASRFFRSLKNGLNSLHGITNRTYFKQLSGFYFSLCQGNEFEMIILYDGSMSHLNHIQIAARIKRLLGLTTRVEFGEYAQFEDRINAIMGISTESQAFGEFYSPKMVDI